MPEEGCVLVVRCRERFGKSAQAFEKSEASYQNSNKKTQGLI